MPEKTELNKLYENLSGEIQLTKTAIDTIERTFQSIKDLLRSNLGSDFNIIIFPQGSCSMGTTIKPLNSSDDFDVDLVVALKNKYLEPSKLKTLIGEVLSSHKTYKKNLEERGRAWCINYEKSHVDVVPMLLADDGNLKVTNKLDDGSYEYITSNPYGLTKWFKKRCYGKDYKNEDEPVTDDLKVYKNHRTLQKVIQILKYHRNFYIDKMGVSEKVKPISMLITVIVSELYEDEEDVFEALTNIVRKFPDYLESHKDIDENYFITNPVNTEENFADKWLEYPERKNVFMDWVKAVYLDLIQDANILDRIDYTDRLQPIFNENINKAYNGIGEEQEKYQMEGNMSYNRVNGVNFGSYSVGKTFKRNTFWGR